MAVKSTTTKKKWTFMVYLAGDNNLDGNGVTDLGEMKKVGSDDHLNLIAQFDRAGSKGETKRFYLRKGTTLAKDAVLKLGETDSGDPKALIDFIQWGVKNYPAERYALVLWNHGGGWDDEDVYANERLRSIQRPVRGRIRHTFFLSSLHKAVKTASGSAKLRAILYDDNAKDFLDNVELKKVLAAAKKATGHKIDILGMDACLMSMAEVACQIRAGAQFAVGSEQTEPLEGWPYNTLLAELAKNPSMATKDFAATIVNKYIASYPVSESVTQAAADLTRSDTLMKVIKELAAVLSGGLDNAAMKAALIQARAQVQSYDIQDNIDLVDLCKLLVDNAATDQTIKTACNNVINTVCGADGMVIKSGCKGDAVKNSFGMAIYFPTLSVSSLYAKLDFEKKTGWGGFLGKYVSASRQR